MLMININSEFFKQFEYIDDGTFGTVKSNNEVAFKLYHDLIKTTNGFLVKNPCLKKSYRLKLYRLKKRRKKITKTDLIFDTFSINKIFSGVISTFYHGVTLDKAGSLTTFSEKIMICKTLIDNASELNKYRIYPLDYKLNNILYTDDKKVKIIDLDDVFTKITNFYNPFYKKLSLLALKRTIVAFLDEQFENYVPNELLDETNKYRYEGKISYKKINQYLDNRPKGNIFLFLDPRLINDKVFDKIKDLITTTNLKIVLFYLPNLNLKKIKENSETLSFYEQMIQSFKKTQINIFDIINWKEETSTLINSYITTYDTDGYYLIENNDLKYFACKTDTHQVKIL